MLAHAAGRRARGVVRAELVANGGSRWRAVGRHGAREARGARRGIRCVACDAFGARRGRFAAEDGAAKGAGATSGTTAASVSAASIAATAAATSASATASATAFVRGIRFHARIAPARARVRCRRLRGPIDVAREPGAALRLRKEIADGACGRGYACAISTAATASTTSSSATPSAAVTPSAVVAASTCAAASERAAVRRGRARGQRERETKTAERCDADE